MITAKLVGGLGNQLFQIAATLALAWANEDEAGFNFDSRLLSQGYSALNYKRNLYINLPFFTGETQHVYKEKLFNYYPIPYQPNLALDGFFQSDKYFLNYQDRLRATISLESVTNHWFKYSEPNCAIHVRRGDYLYREDYNPTLSLDYYRQAINYFPSSTRFLVVSDDVEWCKQKFHGYRFSFSSGHTELEDLLLISQCPNQIIANSTFSWWGSWLNTNPNKIIIAPKQWFGTKLQYSTKDLYTNRMIVL